MKVYELIDQLSVLNPNTEVVRDGDDLLYPIKFAELGLAETAASGRFYLPVDPKIPGSMHDNVEVVCVIG